MITAQVFYKGDLRTECVHVRSNNQIVTDAPVDNCGKGEAFSPTDLMATSLVSCMLTTMAIVASKNNIQFTQAEADLQKIMAENPRRINEIVVDIKMPKIDYSEAQKKVLETAAINCPVAKSLHPDLLQKISFVY